MAKQRYKFRVIDGEKKRFDTMRKCSICGRREGDPGMYRGFVKMAHKDPDVCFGCVSYARAWRERSTKHVMKKLVRVEAWQKILSGMTGGKIKKNGSTG